MSAANNVKTGKRVANSNYKTQRFLLIMKEVAITKIFTALIRKR